jgi:hypothetical protein
MVEEAFEEGQGCWTKMDANQANMLARMEAKMDANLKEIVA